MSKTANITEYLNSRKVELSSEAVELATAADLKSISNDVFSNIDSMNIAFSKLVDARNKVRDINSKLLDLKKNLDSNKTDFFNKAKDLGIQPTSIEEYKLALEAQNSLTKILSEASKLI